MATPSRSDRPWEQDLRRPWEPQAPSPVDSSSKRDASTNFTFQFINDELYRPTPGAHASFHLFGELPLDLQRHVWQLSLPETRILNITMSRRKLTPANTHHRTLYQSENRLGNIVSDAGYTLRLRSTEINSPLLYACREANDIVRRHYRIQMPMAPHGSNTNAPLLRFCPETDTILISFQCNKGCEDHIESEQSEDNSACGNPEHDVAHFIHDALAYDPRKKGIRHLGIMTSVHHIALPTELSQITRRAQASVNSTLQGLRSVSLVHLSACRFMGEHDIRDHMIDHQPPEEGEIILNRAYPLWSSVASYETVLVDKRPISRYLMYVECGQDPRRAIRAWQKFEVACGVDITSSSPEKIRFLLAASELEEDLEISTLSQARRLRQQEESMWGVEFDNRNWEIWEPGTQNPNAARDLEFARVHNAVGFWSAPLEVFGPLPDVPDDFYEGRTHRIYNLTEFESEMELGLFAIT